MADLKTTLAKTFALTPEIESLFCVSTYAAYGDLCSLPFNEKDSNELFLIDELQRIMFRILWNFYIPLMAGSCGFLRTLSPYR